MNKAKGQITIVDITDGKTISMSLYPNYGSQSYSADTKQYFPNFTQENSRLIVTPFLYLSSAANVNLMQRPLVTSGSGLKAVRWYINDILVYSTVPGEVDENKANRFNATCNAVGANADANERKNGWTCIVSNNIDVTLTQLNFRCEITYYDASLQGEITAQASTVVTKAEQTSSAFTAQLHAEGKPYILYANDEVHLHGYGLFGGTKDTTGKVYEWQIWNNKDNQWYELPLYYDATEKTDVPMEEADGGQMTVGGKGEDTLYTYWAKSSTSGENNDAHKYGAHLTLNQKAVEDQELIKLIVRDEGESRTAYALFTVDDKQDPYRIEIEGPDRITAADKSIQLVAHVWQNAKEITNISSYDWDGFSYAENGNAIPHVKLDNDTKLQNLDATASTNSTSKTLTIDHSYIDKKATFICTVNI